MQWDATRNAGFTTGTPWLPVYPDYTVFNRDSEAEDEDSVLNHYRALSALRSEHTELIDGKYEELMRDDEAIYAYTRDNGKQKAIILINFTNSEVEYDPGCLGDAGCILSTHENTEKGVLHPYEAVVYE